jgi:hypothetical protein
VEIGLSLERTNLCWDEREEGAEEDIWTYEGRSRRRGRELYNEEIHDLYSLANMIRLITSTDEMSTA